MVNLQKLHGLKILIVENDPGIRETLTRALEDEGCLVEGVISGDGGLASLNKGAFDVIISDFSLSGMNGMEFLKMTKRLYPAAIKIMLAAYGDVDPMSRAFKCGIDEVIEKPFPFESLLYTISKQLARKGAGENR
ncbi:MAG: response regulator [Desulfobacterales bacterium]